MNSQLNQRLNVSLRDENHPYLGSIANSNEGAKTCRIFDKVQKVNNGGSIMINQLQLQDNASQLYGGTCGIGTVPHSNQSESEIEVFNINQQMSSALNATEDSYTVTDLD